MGAGASNGITQVLNTDLARNGYAAINDVVDDVINLIKDRAKGGTITDSLASGTSVKSHTAVAFGHTYTAAPRVRCQVVAASGARLAAVIKAVTTTNFDVDVFTASGSNVGALTPYQVFWSVDLTSALV